MNSSNVFHTLIQVKRQLCQLVSELARLNQIALEGSLVGTHKSHNDRGVQQQAYSTQPLTHPALRAALTQEPA